MSNLAELQAARGRILQQLNAVTTALVADRKELVRQENNLRFASTAQERTAIQGSITTLKQQISQNLAEESRLTQELADIDRQIAQAKIQDGPRDSAGQDVSRAQRANDDRADTLSPSAALVVPAAAAAAAGVTNADQFQTDRLTDIGTNALSRPTTITQGLPPITARPGAARQTITPPNSPGQVIVPPGGPDQRSVFEFGFPGDDAAANTPTSIQGTPTREDALANANPTRAALNRLFAGTISPQSNVLDQYASYTYSISIYLMNPSDYKALIANSNVLPKGAQLILQSGGAPLAGGTLPTIDIQEAQQAADGNGAPLNIPELGRNPNFPLDYYLDDVRLTSVINGKGTNMAHNVVRLQFKVIEPNGITFLDNLYKATDQYVKLSGTPQVNYAAQNYLMVIRFYGYDKDGNLVQNQNLTANSINLQTNQLQNQAVAVEKFIPFQINSIRFRVANKIVEYDCEATAIANTIATGPARGVIPYNVELTSQNLKDLLGGKAQFAAASKQTEGRPTTQPTASAAGVRSPVNFGSFSTTEPPSPFQVGP